MQPIFQKYTLPETNIARPWKWGPWGKRRFRTWKPSIFRGELLISGRVSKNMASKKEDEWLVSIEKPCFHVTMSMAERVCLFSIGVFSLRFGSNPALVGLLNLSQLKINGEVRWFICFWGKVGLIIFRGELLTSGSVRDELLASESI